MRVKIAGLVVLSVALGLCLTAALLTLTVEQTVFRSSFYVNGLERAETFHRLSTELVPRATRSRIQAYYPNVEPAVLAEVVELRRSVFTSDWFSEQTRRFVDGLLPFLLGDAEALSLIIPVADRLQAAGDTFRARVDHSPLSRLMYEELIKRVADKIAKRQRLPFGCTADREVWLEAIRIAAPQDWLAGKLAERVTRALDFLSGRSATLVLTIPLPERQDAIAEAIEVVVGRSNLLHFVRESVLRPALCDKLGGKTIVEQGEISVTSEEIVGSLEGILDTDWGQARQADIVRLLADYLVGKRDDLALEVPLVSLKALATQRITEMVVTKVRAHLATLRPCTGPEAREVLSQKRDPMSCRPTGLANAAFTTGLVAYVEKRTRARVNAAVPDRWLHDPTALQNKLPTETWKLIQTGRRWMRDGAIIDEALVRRIMRADRSEALDSLLVVTRGGWHVSDHDLTVQLDRAQDELTAKEAAARRDRTMERARASARKVRNLQLPLWTGVMLLALGLLGFVGLRWRVRLVALCFGVVLAGFAVLAVGSQVDARVRPLIDGLQVDTGGRVPASTAAAVSEFVPLVLTVLLGDFLDHLAFSAWVTLAVGLALGVGAAALYAKRREDVGPQPAYRRV